jgi:hypothetical protein
VETYGKRKEILSAFMDQYAKTPLFLVGFGDDDLRNTELVPIQMIHNMKLPFRSVLLEFPGTQDTDCHGWFTARFIYYVFQISETPTRGYYVERLMAPRSYNDERWKQELATSPIGEVALQNYDSVKKFAGATESFVFYPGNRTWRYFFNVTNNFGCTKMQTQEMFTEITKSQPFTECQGCEDPTKAGGDFCVDRENRLLYHIKLIAKTLDYINQPQHYIIKETPKLTPREQRLLQKNITPQFSKKPRHIVLDHSQVKVLIDSSKSNGSPQLRTVMPHERRGHWRQLRHERFKEKKAVWVRPADINKGMQWSIDRHTYEVMN